MSSRRQVNANRRGRDIAVGDIHGHFQRLQQALDAIGFDPQVDRLFSVGDLVDRGPDSEQSLAWLAQPWFYAVQGNHEALAIAHVRGQWLDQAMYRASGGGWFLDLDVQAQLRFAAAFEKMPLALELETPGGPVGLLHADCPFVQWEALCEHLDGTPSAEIQEVCQWSRRRLQQGDNQVVQGLRALIVGHTTLREVKVLGNVWHLDTGGWASGHFSLLELASLTLLQNVR